MRNVLSKLRQLLSGKADHQSTSGGAANTYHIEIGDAAMRKHLALSGRIGSGVSRYVEHLLTRQTEQGRGWVYIDPTADGTMLSRLAETARAQGRSHEFYVLNLSDPQNSNTYDVLRAGSPVDQAIRALQALPVAVNNPGADFYAQQCFDVLVPVLAAVKATGKTVGLNELGRLLLQLESEATQQDLLAAVPGGSEARASLLGAFESLKGMDGTAKSRNHALRGLAGRLLGIGAVPGADVFNSPRPEIEFSDILAHNKMCYVALPLTMDPESTLVSLASMVLHDVSSSIQARAEMPADDRVPFLFVMDRFPGYGIASGIRAPIRPTIYSQARGQAVSMVPVMTGMSWESLRDAYSEREVEQLTGNTYTKVYFHQEQGELTSALHPSLAEGTLDRLDVGEYVVCSGAEVQFGAIAPLRAVKAPARYVKQEAFAGNARERLKVGDAPEARA